MALADALDRDRDVIFSNHRCHGHYLAWTSDVEGLLAEIMGRRGGVCRGLGGSQHLCSRRFFSNGIQGGSMPVAAGLAFAHKLEGRGGIVTACIGDGTLGEGVVYETFNMAAKWGLPLLIVLENNRYAQSTAQTETLAGGIDARAAAFGIQTFKADTWDAEHLAQELERAVQFVRAECAPAFVRVDTYRLGAHSKGDDDRPPQEIADYTRRDPLNVQLECWAADPESPVPGLRRRIQEIVERIEGTPLLDLSEQPGALERPAYEERTIQSEAGTQLEAINHSLHHWMMQDSGVYVIGEDVRSPYGGAFKVTRGLSDCFADRVINCPISEAAIVGFGNGLSLSGRRAIVEVMFGDFLTLCFDQILNHAAKFRGMYGGQVENPLIIRTPMGGGRGYGPTHSQNLEKHVAGIPGLRMLVMHGRTRVSPMYENLRALVAPVLIVENKLLYRERDDAPLPAGYCRRELVAPFPATILRPSSQADITILAFGRMSVLAEQAASELLEEEVYADLVFPLEVWPLDLSAVMPSVAVTRKLLVVEEGASGFDLASEVIASVSLADGGAERIRFRRLGAIPMPIPSALALERQVLPSVERIVAAALELFDE